MSIVELSKLIGVSEETLIDWENGISEPSIPEIIKLTQVFNIKVDDFVRELAEYRQHIKRKSNSEEISKHKNAVSDFVKETDGIEDNRKIFMYIIASVFLFCLIVALAMNGDITNSKIEENEELKSASELEKCGLNNPFDEEIVDLRYVIAGSHMYEEVTVGPLQHLSTDYERLMITFSLIDVEDKDPYECYFKTIRDTYIEVFIFHLNEDEMNKWFLFDEDKNAVYVKGLVRFYSDDYTAYIEATEIKLGK
jgi:transcriptional regulator with XRE-family HTH domain